MSLKVMVNTAQLYDRLAQFSLIMQNFPTYVTLDYEVAVKLVDGLVWGQSGGLGAAYQMGVACSGKIGNGLAQIWSTSWIAQGSCSSTQAWRQRNTSLDQKEKAALRQFRLSTNLPNNMIPTRHSVGTRTISLLPWLQYFGRSFTDDSLKQYVCALSQLYAVNILMLTFIMLSLLVHASFVYYTGNLHF